MFVHGLRRFAQDLRKVGADLFYAGLRSETWFVQCLRNICADMCLRGFAQCLSRVCAMFAYVCAEDNFLLKRSSAQTFPYVYECLRMFAHIVRKHENVFAVFTHVCACLRCLRTGQLADGMATKHYPMPQGLYLSALDSKG
jgi:hypothetical protein